MTDENEKDEEEEEEEDKEDSGQEGNRGGGGGSSEWQVVERVQCHSIDDDGALGGGKGGG